MPATSLCSSFIHLSLFNSPAPTHFISAFFFVSFLLTSSTSFPRCLVQITTPAWPFPSPSSLPFSAVLGLWLMTSTLHWTADYIELVVEQHIETTHTPARASTGTHTRPQTAQGKVWLETLQGAAPLNHSFRVRCLSMLFKNSHQAEGEIEQSALSLDITASLTVSTSSYTKHGSAAKPFPIND